MPTTSIAGFMCTTSAVAALTTCCVMAYADDVPVSEIKLQATQPQKTEFAYKEMQRAEGNLEAAQKDAAEAERAYQQAQHQAEEAQKRLATAKQKVEKNKAAAQEARKKWEAESEMLQRGGK